MSKEKSRDMVQLCLFSGVHCKEFALCTKHLWSYETAVIIDGIMHYNNSYGRPVVMSVTEKACNVV